MVMAAICEEPTMIRNKNTDLVVLCSLVAVVAVGLSFAQKPSKATPTPVPTATPPLANSTPNGLLPASPSTLAASAAPSNSVDDPSLMLWLPLNGSAVDEGPLHLKCSANAVTFDDQHGGSAIFGRDSYISVEQPERFNEMSSFSLSAWICPSQLCEHANIISKVRPNRDFNLQMAHTGQIVAHIANPNYEFCTSKRQLQPNQWVHVGATYSDHQWKLYINGALDTSTKVIRGPGWSGESLTIGNLLPHSNEPFWGRLDEVRIYRGELAKDSFEALMKSD
jgi:hypothetical protein